jgi:hypothetical protein
MLELIDFRIEARGAIDLPCVANDCFIDNSDLKVMYQLDD